MQKPIDRSTTCLRYLYHTWRRGLRLTWSVYSLCSSPDHKGDSTQDTRCIRWCFQNISIVRCQQISVGILRQSENYHWFHKTLFMYILRICFLEVSEKVVQIFFKFGTKIPFCNNWKTFGNQKNPITFALGVSPKTLVLGPE